MVDQSGGGTVGNRRPRASDPERSAGSARQTTLARVARAVAESLDPATVAQAACRALRGAFAAEFVAVHVVTPAGLRAVAVDAQPSLAVHRSRWLAEHGLYRPEGDHPFKGAEAWRETRYVADLAAAAPDLKRRLPLALEV